MCGIGGIVEFGGRPSDRLALRRISDAMAARGPDGEGYWQDGASNAFVHRRLSIIDLSDGGTQPMVDPATGSVIVFNGEIYNYAELKSQLESEGERFTSGSDTEVLLALYRTRGREMLGLLRGMFAFAIWSPRDQSLFLARDPFGIKPLYIAATAERLVFASQVKAILASGLVATDPDPAGHTGFFRWGSVPEPFTLYRAIRALPAGGWAEWTSHGTLREGRYHSLREEVLAAQTAAVPIAAAEARDRLRAALHSTMAAHFVSDVPVGVFLSGGLDSAMMLGLAAEAGHTGVTAVTLAYDEFTGTAHDEAAPARETAQHFGARHHVERLSREDFVAAREALLAAMDQPTIDGVNTYFVSRAAHRQGMKVMLSGLGGDELFGGYSDFERLPAIHRRLRHLAAVPGADAAWRSVARLLGIARARPKAAALLGHAGSLERLYLLSRSLIDPDAIATILDPDTLCAGLAELETEDRLAETTAGIGDDKSKLSLLNANWYMRNQLLRDSDWAGMAHSLEIRVPLVDLPFWREVLALRYGGHDFGKDAMIASLARPLPASIAQRTKTGFAIPVRQWLGDTGRERGLLPWAKVVHAHFAGAVAP